MWNNYHIILCSMFFTSDLVSCFTTFSHGCFSVLIPCSPTYTYIELSIVIVQSFFRYRSDDWCNFPESIIVWIGLLVHVITVVGEVQKLWYFYEPYLWESCPHLLSNKYCFSSSNRIMLVVELFPLKSQTLSFDFPRHYWFIFIRSFRCQYLFVQRWETIRRR